MKKKRWLDRITDRIFDSFEGMNFRNFRALLQPKYEEVAFGVEGTWYMGLGFGVGLGKYDFWMGWPRDRG